VVNRGTALAVALAASLSASGCGEEPGPEPASGAPAGEEVGVLRAFPPSPSGGYATASQEVLRDPAAWAAAWKRANAHQAPVPAAPAVDFGKEMVALAALGERPSAGFGIEIVGARREGGSLRILYSVTEPAPGGMSATVMTQPWHAVVLPRSDGPVEWVKYAAPTTAPPTPPK
jgi:hypothetical protein